MKRIEVFKCETCGQLFSSESGARRCEAKPIAPSVPRGTIVFDGPYIHGVVLLQVLERAEEGTRHRRVASYWTFRDDDKGGPTIGDSTPLNNERTTGPEIGSDQRHDWRTIPVDVTTSRYARAWSAMNEAGLPMYLWVDGAAVPAPAPPGAP